MTKKATPLDKRIKALQDIRKDFREWRFDDTSYEQEVLVREAIRKLDSVIALMMAFRRLA